MKFRKLYITCTIFLICTTMVLFSGCSLIGDIIWEKISRTYYDEYNLEILSAINCSKYIFSEKVTVSLDSSVDDQLDIITKINDDSYDTQKILEGEFKKFGYYDDKIFIYTNNCYYMFDIANYDIDEYNKTQEYQLVEYSEDKFDEEYEDYKKIDWEL